MMNSHRIDAGKVNLTGEGKKICINKAIKYNETKNYYKNEIILLKV